MSCVAHVKWTSLPPVEFCLIHMIGRIYGQTLSDRLLIMVFRAQNANNN